MLERCLLLETRGDAGLRVYLGLTLRFDHNLVIPICFSTTHFLQSPAHAVEPRKATKTW